jgi:hypothetical protein
MKIIVCSLIGTLAAVCMLACTAGATLYCSHCIELAIRDAVARELDATQPQDAIRCIAATTPPACDVCAEACPRAACVACADACAPADEGMALDSKVVAVLIQELCDASPAERAVWMKLLRNPNSDESYFNFFAHYHDKSPLSFHRTCTHAQFTSAESEPGLSPTCACPCAALKCEKCDAVKSAIAVIQDAERLLLEQAAADDLPQLRALCEKLGEKRQQLQASTEGPGFASEAPCDNDD